jgi:cell division transport system permease protein
MPAVRESLIAFRRAPLLSALSITTIAFSLFAVGLFGLVVLNIRDALEKVEERVEIRAFISDKAPVEQVALAANDIAKYEEVQSVDLVTKDEALERARRELGEFRDVFEAEFLPASLDVRMKPGYRDPASVHRVADRLKALTFVDDVRFGEDWIQQLYRLRNIAGVAAAALGLAFAAIAIIIIGSTIRMAVLARSREISIMRLVGATDSYIRRPFLIEGFVKGILGGLLALGLTWIAIRAVSSYLSFQTVFFDQRLAMLGLAGGAFMGLVGSAFSVGRHLRRV